jgi:uncharacterized protein
MDCPRCPGEKLITIERDGIEIDTCPRCRGVWLDRGELDKLLDKSFRSPPSQALEQRSRHDDSSSSYHRRGGNGQMPRRKSWLTELFD